MTSEILAFCRSLRWALEVIKMANFYRNCWMSYPSRIRFSQSLLSSWTYWSDLPICTRLSRNWVIIESSIWPEIIWISFSERLDPQRLLPVCKMFIDLLRSPSLTLTRSLSTFSSTFLIFSWSQMNFSLLICSCWLMSENLNLTNRLVRGSMSLLM